MPKNKRYRKKNNKCGRPDKCFRKKVLSVMKEEVEKKFIDALAINNPVGYDSPLVIPLSNPAQGLGDGGNRVGDKITLNGFHQEIIASPTTAAVYRWVVFQWHMDSAAIAPTPALVLASTASGADVIAPYNHDHAPKFTIICDKTFTSVASGDSNLAVRQCTLNLNKIGYGFKKEVSFNAASANGENLLYMMIITSNPVAAGDLVTFYGRTTYRDA